MGLKVRHLLPLLRFLASMAEHEQEKGEKQYRPSLWEEEKNLERYSNIPSYRGPDKWSATVRVLRA